MGEGELNSGNNSFNFRMKFLKIFFFFLPQCNPMFVYYGVSPAFFIKIYHKTSYFFLLKCPFERTTTNNKQQQKTRIVFSFCVIGLGVLQNILHHQPSMCSVTHKLLCEHSAQPYLALFRKKPKSG